MTGYDRGGVDGNAHVREVGLQRSHAPATKWQSRENDGAQAGIKPCPLSPKISFTQKWDKWGQ